MKNYTLYIMPLLQPAKNMVDELKRREYIRQENIKDLFVQTIYSLDVVQKTYDYCFSRLKAYSKGKHDFYTLHKRAYNLTLKLLTKC